MLTERLIGITATFGADWVNWVLVAFSILGLAVFIDRAVLYWRTRERFPALRAAVADGLARGEVEAVRRAIAGDSLARNVLRAGLDAVDRGDRAPGPVEQAMLGALAAERARYEARLAVLTTIGNVAPLVGLLGTVIGIVGAFYVLGRLETVQAAGNPKIMSAIGEALVATGFSINVAVPAVVAVNGLRAALAARVKQAEALVRDLLANVHRLGAPGGGAATGTAP